MNTRTKFFQLLKDPSEKYIMICFSLDATRPDVYSDDLEFLLRKGSKVGKVLIDLFLSNGNNSRRFFEVVFNGRNLCWQEAKIKTEMSLDKKTREFCTEFYLNKKTLIKSNMILSETTKHKFLSRSNIALSI